MSNTVTRLEWYGLFASSKVPAPAVAKLQEQLMLAIAKPEMIAAAKRLEVEPRAVDAAGLTRLLETDHRRWDAIVRATGIALDT